MRGRYCKHCGKLCLPSGFAGAWQHYHGPCCTDSGVRHGPVELMPEGCLLVRKEETIWNGSGERGVLVPEREGFNVPTCMVPFR